MFRILGSVVLAMAMLYPTTVRAQFQPVFGASDTRQVVADGDSTYILKGSGECWQWSHGAWTKIDDSAGTASIAAANGVFYLVKTDGKLWRRAFGAWTDAGGGIVQMVAAGNRLDVLQANSNVYQMTDGTWAQIDQNAANSKLIAGDELGNVYVMKENGHIWHYDTAQWRQVDDGSGTRSMVAASGILYVLKNSGNIWRFSGGQWAKVDDGTGTKQLTADGHDLFALKDNGNIWMYRNEKWAQVDNGTGTKAIDAKGGNLAVLKDNGATFSANTATLSAIASMTRAKNFRKVYGAVSE